MKHIKNIHIILVHSLLLSLFFSGCISKSRYLNEVADKDLLIKQLQDENDKNAALEKAKNSLKDRLSEMSRQTNLNENEQHRKIVTLEDIAKSQKKEIETLRSLLKDKKKKVFALEGLLSAEAVQSNNLKETLLQIRRSSEFSEKGFRKRLKSDEMEIQTLKEAIAKSAGRASELQSHLVSEVENSEAIKKRLAQMEKISAQRKRKLQETAKTSERLIKQLRGEIEEGNVMISKMKGRLSVQIVNKVLFASGSNRVSKKGKKILKNVSKALKEVKESTIRIEGHTDDVPISSNLSDRFPSNWELSTARATQVVRYLIDEEVNPKNLMAVGMSQYDPVVPNDSPEGRQMNRRIEIVLVPKEKARM